MRFVYNSQTWLMTFRSKLINDSNTQRSDRVGGWSQQRHIFFENSAFPSSAEMLEAMKLYNGESGDDESRHWQYQVLGCIQYEFEHSLIVQGDPIEEPS